MSEEFKYIPYSPDDENLRGLIRDGNVYNIKTPVIPGMGETGGYSMSSTGIMLPDCDDGTDEMMRDIEYMKEMYPEELRKVSMAVEEECDKLEYEGSPMLVQYPDREEMRRVARRVYDDLSESGTLSEDCYAGMASAGEASYEEPPYVPEGPGCANCVMRNIIELLVCNEFCMRRDRHRRRRRRFY